MGFAARSPRQSASTCADAVPAFVLADLMSPSQDMVYLVPIALLVWPSANLSEPSEAVSAPSRRFRNLESRSEVAFPL